MLSDVAPRRQLGILSNLRYALAEFAEHFRRVKRMVDGEDCEVLLIFYGGHAFRPPCWGGSILKVMLLFVAHPRRVGFLQAIQLAEGASMRSLATFA